MKCVISQFRLTQLSGWLAAGLMEEWERLCHFCVLYYGRCMRCKFSCQVLHFGVVRKCKLCQIIIFSVNDSGKKERDVITEEQNMYLSYNCFNPLSLQKHSEGYVLIFWHVTHLRWQNVIAFHIFTPHSVLPILYPCCTLIPLPLFHPYCFPSPFAHPIIISLPIA
jgi:hypothetical protein